MEIREKLLQLALRKLQYRNHSAQELQNYLMRKAEGQEDAVDDVMTQLKKMRLIDDELFAREWTRSRLNKGKGDYLAERELQQKGISSLTITETIQDIDEQDWIASARKQYKKKANKFDSLPQYQKIGRIKQYLFQRGYSSNIINALIDDLQDKGVK